MDEQKNKQRHVLIIEDDLELAELVAQELRFGGFKTHIAQSGREAAKLLKEQTIALVLLDLMLPGEDGLEICKQIRRGEHSPAIIMVTARGELVDKVTGLELGADDYVVKPFEARELLARCKAVMRRQGGGRATTHTAEEQPVTEPVRYGFLGWSLDIKARQLYSPEGVMISLPNSDFHVLAALVESPGKVLSRALLLERAFSRSMSYEDRAVDVCISRLRQHLEKDRSKPELIRTVRNEGYVLYVDPAHITVQ
ncbi:response regulator transcription factor [Paenalcaligenes sp. Me131]|uniref:response regulator transcription factor n=1 Tax=Paenalcaligenes sp. Me131 TaxID=3392636 RepID=UPI003D2C1AE4